MFYKRICLLALSIIALTLTGCQTPALYNQTNANVADVVQKTTEARHISDASGKPTPPLVINQGVYVDKTPVSLERDPVWLKNRLIIRGDQLPFSYYSRTIVSGGKNVLTHYQVGLDQTVQVSVNYSGSVKGALDLLAAKSGYVYTVHGNDIYWQAFITRTFDIAFMPGQSDYMMGKSSGASSGGSSGGGSGSGSGSGVVTAYVDDSASAQYSNLRGTLSIWNDLESTIKQILSADGKVVVSQSTTSVTVRDRPTNVSLVGKYVANLNSNLSKKVLVKVQILEVSLNSDFNYGIDWSIVENAFSGSNFILNANYGTPVSINVLTGGTTPPQFGISKSTTGQTWFSLIVNALKQQGKVSVVSEPRVVCLNNQVSVIRIIDNTGYLASVQTTAFGGSNASASQTNQNSVTSQITPGNLVTGLTLYILPKLMGNKIYLQVNADLINSLGIVTLSANGTTSPSASSTQPAIQVPNTEQKQFNQRSVLRSGETLILAGFRKISNQSGAMQLLDSQALGGRAAAQSNSETIVLITPIILHGLA